MCGTLVVIAATAIIVLWNKDMFFETRHVGRLLEDVSKEGARPELLGKSEGVRKQAASTGLTDCSVL